jgi:parallel beta-helix repeat protein
MKIIHVGLFGQVLAALLMIFSLPTNAVNYYVDANQGNNAWTGRFATTQGAPAIDGPWKSITEVNKRIFVPGDTIYLACGSTWREPLIISRSGNRSAPLSIVRYGNCTATNQPTLNGARVVAGWTRHSAASNIWKAAVPYRIAQVLVDGVFVNPAQYPNAGEAFLRSGAGSSPTQLKMNDVTLSASQLKDAGVQIRSINYRMRYRTVTQFNPVTNTISWPTPTDGQNSEGSGYYFVNKFWMLDHPGEWYFEKATNRPGGTLYIWTPNGAAPATLAGATSNMVEATPAESVAVSVTNQADVKIGALKIVNADIGIDLTDSAAVSLNSTTVLNAARFGVRANASSSAKLNAVLIRNSGAQGVQAEYAQNLTILNSTLENSGNVGTLRTSPPPEEYQLYGINCYGCRAVTIQDNTVKNAGYIAIRADPPPTPAPNTPNRIVGNYIENACTLLDDCGAIYTFGRTLETNPGDPAGYPNRGQIINNIINHVRGNPNGRIEAESSAQGIYLDDYANGVEVIGNTVIDANNGIQLHLSKNNIVRQNTLFANRGYQIWMQEDVSDGNAGACPPDGANCLRNNVIQGNLLFPTNGNVSVRAESGYATVTDFAHYDQNRYANLYASRIVSEAYQTGNQSIDKSYSLAQWQAARREDLTSSVFKQFGVAPYRIVNLPGVTNLVSNSTFPSKDISTWTSYSTGISALAWEPKCIVTGCLKLSRTHVAAIFISNSFAVQLGHKYLVRFEARTGNSPAISATAVLRKNGPTYEDLADTNSIELSSVWRNYAFVATANGSYNPARLDIELPLGSGDVYLDNVVVREVNTLNNDPSNDAYIYFNRYASALHRACPFGGTLASRCAEFVYFWDGVSHNAPVVWPVTIPAKGSRIVVWTGNPFKDSDLDGIADSDDQCIGTAPLESVDERGCSFSQLH